MDFEVPRLCALREALHHARGGLGEAVFGRRFLAFAVAPHSEGLEPGQRIMRCWVARRGWGRGDAVGIAYRAARRRIAAGDGADFVEAEVERRA